MGRPWRAASFACCLLLLAQPLVVARVQLVTDNPSPFVSSNPDDPQYIISLFDDAATAASVVPEASSLRSLVMADSTGKRFNCSIPTSPPAASTTLAPLEEVVPDAQLQIVKSPFELLDALTALCLYHKDGLWTYEVCHRKHVRQFRKDNNGRKQEDFSCGQYLGDDQQIEAILEDSSSSGHPVKYVSHTFGGGAKCVLTGQSRTSEVRYTCARHIPENTVLSVREFPTCNYVVVVSTPFLCKHPEFVPQPEDVRVVSCVPLDQPGPAAAAAAATGALPAAAGMGTATAAKPSKMAAPGQQQQQELQQPAGAGAAGSTAAAQAASAGSEEQPPPEIGIELKSAEGQEEEDVNDVEGFVVEAYTADEEGEENVQVGDGGTGSPAPDAQQQRQEL